MARIVQKALKNEKDNGGDDEVESECWRPIVILRLGFEYVKDFAEDGEMVVGDGFVSEKVFGFEEMFPIKHLYITFILNE